MQERLREGVEAARRGDKLAARRLLQQVLIADPSNEIALMWMASVVDSLAERRSYLEKALRVNPNNERAREALRRLGGAGAASPPPSPALAVGAQAGQSGGANLLLLLVAVIVIVVAVIAVALALNDQERAAGAAVQQNAAATFEAALAVTETPTPVPGTPTPTEFFGIVVTLDPAQVELPPTFTPTFTPTPTETPLPTATPLPLSEFEVLYSDYEVNAPLPALYRAFADGSSERLLSDAGYLDVAISPDGQRIAFVRGVGGAPEAAPVEPAAPDDPDATLAPTEPPPTPLPPGGLPQLFVAPIDNPASAVQITNLTGEMVSSPSWSPDGRTIVFASGDGSSSDLYLISAEGGALERLTDDNAFHTSPSFSPRGDRIVFASDLESPGFSEIYTIEVATRVITRLTDDIGNSYSPAYSPDGTRIAYINDRNGDGDVYVMDANGQRSFLLTTDDGGAEDRTPAWSPDGRWIAFASNRGGATFRWFLLNVETRAIVPLADHARSAQSLAFFPR